MPTNHYRDLHIILNMKQHGHIREASSRTLKMHMYTATNHQTLRKNYLKMQQIIIINIDAGIWKIEI